MGVAIFHRSFPGGLSIMERVAFGDFCIFLENFPFQKTLNCPNQPHFLEENGRNRPRSSLQEASTPTVHRNRWGWRQRLGWPMVRWACSLLVGWAKAMNDNGWMDDIPTTAKSKGKEMGDNGWMDEFEDGPFLLGFEKGRHSLAAGTPYFSSQMGGKIWSFTQNWI